MLTIHDCVHYLHIDVTKVVGLAGLPPAEDGRVQMLSFVTEDKLSEVGNGVTYHAGLWRQ